jgi:hypothetical protein
MAYPFAGVAEEMLVCCVDGELRQDWAEDKQAYRSNCTQQNRGESEAKERS